MKPITQRLTKTNFNKRGTKPKFLVLHYVGAESTAKNNAEYFHIVYRGSSANYFVDEVSIYQVVKDTDTAWHCGSKKGYKHSECRNNNSIGIEMCVKKKNGKWFYEQETIKNTSDLVQHLMKKYNIPAENVIRHYDVTGRACPANYLTDSSWKELKEQLIGKTITKPTTNELKVNSKVVLNKSSYKYATGQIIPSWCKGKTYTVQQIKNDRVLLKEIYSWVFKKDITLKSAN